ncbi:MAG: hypothetical protein IPM49_06445 [Flavobacteriales bacterium]|nr:hypothetical protein [Flavobacteriales bacterium]
MALLPTTLFAQVAAAVTRSWSMLAAGLTLLGISPALRAQNYPVPSSPELAFSQGHYPEVFGNDTLRRIGNWAFSTVTGRAYRIGGQEQVEANHVRGSEGVGPNCAIGRDDIKMGRFLSLDPLAAKYPHNSPYAFSENRVIDGIELEGLEWKDIKGQELSEEARKDVKAFIFYDSRSSEGEGGFSAQTNQMYGEMESTYGKGSVALSAVSTESQFAQDWSDISGTDVRNVSMLTHGSPQSIFLNAPNKEYLTSTGNGKTEIFENDALNISDLPQPTGNIKNADLWLYSCHSNGSSKDQKGSMLSVAQAFRNGFDFRAVHGTPNSVSFSHGRPVPSIAVGGWFDKLMVNRHFDTLLRPEDQKKHDQFRVDHADELKY